MALVLLDAGLIGLAISEPKGKNLERDANGQDFRAWLRTCSGIYHRFAVADVTRYEATREWHRLGATQQLHRIGNLLAASIIPVKVTPEVWDRAAILWGQVRRRGRPTAATDALDGDAILAAVAAELASTGQHVLIATTNVGHLRDLGADAREWRSILNSD